MEMCECGFVWESVPRSEITNRVRTAAVEMAKLLNSQDVKQARERTEPERWSNLEYGAHARDVMLTIRDRLVIGLVENNPGFKPLYKDERIDLGLYMADNAHDVAAETTAAASMFERLFDAIDPTKLDRMVQYGFPNPGPRTLLWMGQQAVHEVEHHLGDMRKNLQMLDEMNTQMDKTPEF
jgi:hypothetical protein